MAIAHGVRTIEVIRRVAPHLDAEAEASAIENHEADDQQGVHVMPGAVGIGALDSRGAMGRGHFGFEAAGHESAAPLRIAGSGSSGYVGRCHTRKAASGAVFEGRERLGFDPAECLVIEDAPAGIQSARAGGMKVIGITSTYKADALEHADAVIGKLAEIQVTSNGAGKLAVDIG